MLSAEMAFSEHQSSDWKRIAVSVVVDVQQQQQERQQKQHAVVGRISIDKLDVSRQNNITLHLRQLELIEASTWKYRLAFLRLLKETNDGIHQDTTHTTPHTTNRQNKRSITTTQLPLISAR